MPSCNTSNQGKSAASDSLFSRYSEWLGQENTRVGISNWQCQAIMGSMFALVALLSVPALLAWIHGASWNSMTQTATRRGMPVMHPIGGVLLIGASFLAGGSALLLIAVCCRPGRER